MAFVRKNVLFIVGIAVLLLVGITFFATMKAEGSLEDGSLSKWRGAAESRRIAAVKILTGSEQNNEIMVACLDKMALLPESGTLKIKDAAALCLTGVLLKDNL
jgi:hypothetical protein